MSTQSVPLPFTLIMPGQLHVTPPPVLVHTPALSQLSVLFVHSSKSPHVGGPPMLFVHVYCPDGPQPPLPVAHSLMSLQLGGKPKLLTHSQYVALPHPPLATRHSLTSVQ